MTLLTCNKCNHTTGCVYCDSDVYRTNALEPEPILKMKKPSFFKRLDERMGKVDWNAFFNRLEDFIKYILLIIAIVGVIGVIGLCIYKTATADGKIDYCVVGRDSGNTYLNAHRRWRLDANLGNCEPAECKKKAEEIGCPFGILK